jgi:hypothetical protein
MKIVFDENLFFFILFIKKIFLTNIKQNQENNNRTKTDSGTLVENTLMWNKNIEGTRQIYSLTSG